MHAIPSYRRPALIRLIVPVILCFMLLLAVVMPAQAGGLAAPAAQTTACTPGEAVRPLTLAETLPANCDDCSRNGTFGFTINYFGNSYSNTFVASNGYLKLNNATAEFTPFSLATATDRIIAPFFADVDIRSGGGTVFYGPTTVNGHPAFAVTYDQVGYFNRHTDKLNTFQVLIIDRSDVALGDFDLEFNYDQIQWETGDASGGTAGLGGTSAVAGYTAGDGVNYFQFPGSLVNGGLLDSNLSTGLVNGSTNSETCGRHVVSVRSGARQDPPVATADDYSTDKGVQLVVPAPGVLDNDTDPQSDTLSAVLVTGPDHGTLNLAADGSFTYSPAAGFSGSDSFTYQASDNYFTSEAEVTITVVNHAPEIAEGDSTDVSMSEDGAPTAFSLTLNGTDPDGDPLTWSVISGPTHGSTATGGTGASFDPAYTPDTNFYGSDSFTVQVSDGDDGLDSIVVNVTVEAVNDAPDVSQGYEVAVTMSEDSDPQPFALTLTAVDAEGDSITWSLGSSPAHGNATAAGSGGTLNPTYTPEANFNGSDSFTILVSDSFGAQHTVTVNVTVQPVNDFPVIDQGTEVLVTMSEDGDPTAFSLTLSAQDVDGDELTWSLGTAPTNGSAAAAGTGSTLAPTYTPQLDFHGADSFIVQVEDGFGGTDSLTVNITIEPVNDAPRITEGDSLTVEMSEDGDPTPFDLTLHAVDPESDPISWSLIQGPTNGEAQASGSGESLLVDYTPDPNFSGTDSFIVQAADDSDASNQIVIQVQVLPVNDAPQAEAGIDMEVVEGAAVSFSGNYQDPDGEADVVQIDWDFGDGTTASGTLTPQHSYQDNGVYTVRLTVTDNGSVSVSDELLVTVQNADPALPLLADRQAYVDQMMSFAAFFTDPGSADTHTASVDWGDGESSPAVIDAQDRSLQASHTYQAEGLYTVLVTLMDDDGGQASSQFQVQVTIEPTEPTMYRIIIPVILTSP